MQAQQAEEAARAERVAAAAGSAAGTAWHYRRNRLTAEATRPRPASQSLVAT